MRKASTNDVDVDYLKKKRYGRGCPLIEVYVKNNFLIWHIGKDVGKYVDRLTSSKDMVAQVHLAGCRYTSCRENEGVYIFMLYGSDGKKQAILKILNSKKQNIDKNIHFHIEHSPIPEIQVSMVKNTYSQNILRFIFFLSSHKSKAPRFTGWGARQGPHAGPAIMR